MNSSNSSRRVLKFGVFEADLAAGELRKSGLKIRLQEQPFQVLALLLENPGQVVSREELRHKLWPADTFVDFDNGLNTAINKIREALGDSADHPKFIETLPRRGYRFLQSLERKDEKSIDTLVVLPLENLSRDPEQEYFAEGMTEALITTLAKIGALRVVSRTTAMHYKGVHRPLREIANELQADAVVEGSVLRSGDHVRISAQLIDGRTDTHLWAESYERDLRDIIGLQSELAQAIAREIHVTLTAKEKAHFTKTRTVDPEAYESYLKGRYYWNRRTLGSLSKAFDFFQKAIDKDPGDAVAYVGLADACVILGYWGFVAPAEGAGRAKSLALKAIEIDNTLAEAHASLAFATMHYDHDFYVAEQEFVRSIELNPRYATARQWHALYLAAMGHWEPAVDEINRAIQLDPVSPIIHVAYSGMLFLTRRYEEAIEEAQRGLELDPASLQSRWTLGIALGLKGKHEQAISELQKGAELSCGAGLFVSGLGYVYAAAGEKDAARKVLEQLNQPAQHRYVMAYWRAMIHAALEERDEALRNLEDAYEERSSWLVFLKVQPWFDNLRSDFRFLDLLRRMRFPI